MAETMNMMEISVEKFCEEVKYDIEDENYAPMVGIGKSGVGKTMGIYEVTQEMGIGFCELRLVTLNEIDMLGIPKENEAGRTTYASNDLLPDAERDGEVGVLVLDEITSAASTVRAAAYQLLDSKRSLGNYTLPPKWKVIALGNGPDDGGVFQGMECAFLSRATCYRIEPKLSSWKPWAVRNGVNPSVIAFLNFDPSALHVFDPDEIASVFPCPRSWTALSKKLNDREKKNGGLLTTENVELYAAGTVGMQVASSFAAFYNFNKKTIKPEDIIAGKVKGEVVRDLEAQVIHIILSSVVKLTAEIVTKGQISKTEFTPEAVTAAANVVNWAIEVANYKLDLALTCFADLVRGSKAFKEMAGACEAFDDASPNFLIFCSENSIIFG
jgi:hypothetical protein